MVSNGQSADSSGAVGTFSHSEDDSTDQNLLTVTSLSGKPLLDTITITPISKRAKRKKNDVQALRSRFVPPDGGYGWLVAFGAFLVQFWIAGLIKSYGVIFMEVMQMFPDASASLASWIPAILSTICLVLSPVSSGLCQRFSCRSVVFVGGILCWLGISLSFFATNLVQLCMTFGVLTGIGAGLSTTPGIIMTSRYFSKHRALANGICVSGTAAGSMAIPPLMEILVPLYGFRGAILVLGGCMLHVCLAASFYRPVEVHQAIVEYDSMAKNVAENSHNEKAFEKSLHPSDQWSAFHSEDGCPVNDQNIGASHRSLSLSPQRLGMVHSVEDLTTDSTIYYKETQLANSDRNQPAKNKKTGWIKTVHRYVDLKLATDPLFLLMSSTVMLMAVGCPHALFYLPSFAYSKGLSRSDCSLLLSISAVLDLCGRLGLGYVADLKLFPNSKVYSISMLTSGVAVLCIPFAFDFATFAVIVSFYGFGLGCWFLLIPVLLSEHHGTDSIASSYGLVRLFQGTITLATPPFIGFTKDWTGDYLFGFYFMGVSMIIGSILIHFDQCAKRRSLKNLSEQH